MREPRPHPAAAGEMGSIIDERPQGVSKPHSGKSGALPLGLLRQDNIAQLQAICQLSHRHTQLQHSSETWKASKYQATRRYLDPLKPPALTPCSIVGWLARYHVTRS